MRRFRHGDCRHRGAPVAVQHWLFVRGTGDHPLARYVDANQLRSQHSTRRPAIQRRDFAVCYASVWQVIFAVVEVVGHPEQDPTRSRWAWRIPLRPRAWIDDLDLAPPVQAAGVFPSSLGRHSYVRLTPEQFRTARELIEASS